MTLYKKFYKIVSKKDLILRKILLLSLILLSFVIILSGCGKKETTVEPPSKKEQPNALDYMAPGYRQTQDKLKQVQDLRQKAIEENNIEDYQ